MGFSLSWIAVDGKRADEVCAALAVRPTGVWEEIPESPIVGTTLPNGLYLVVANQQLTVCSEDLLATLSLNCEIVICRVEEHVMYSSAAAWTDGRKIWEIIHDAQKGVGHLETGGDLPSEFMAIHDKRCSEQQQHGGDESDTDYIFDVSVDVAEAITGYRYDKIISDDDVFEVLAPISDGIAVKRE